jgi:hypothetical protein
MVCQIRSRTSRNPVHPIVPILFAHTAPKPHVSAFRHELIADKDYAGQEATAFSQRGGKNCVASWLNMLGMDDVTWPNRKLNFSDHEPLPRGEIRFHRQFGKA